MKQTAVEWLVDKILVANEVHNDKAGNWIDEPRTEYLNAYKDYVDLSEYVEQAKQMEHEQLKEIYINAIANYPM